MLIVIYNVTTKVVVGYREHHASPMLTAQQLFDLFPDEKSDLAFSELDAQPAGGIRVESTMFDPITKTFTDVPNWEPALPPIVRQEPTE